MFALPRSNALICKRKDAGLDEEKRRKLAMEFLNSCNVTISTPPNSKKSSCFFVPFVVKNLLDACYLLLILHAALLMGGEIRKWEEKEAFTFQHRDWLQVVNSAERLTFTTADYVVSLNPTRNFILEHFSADGSSPALLQYISLSMARHDHPSETEAYCGKRVSDFQLETQTNEASFVVIQDWPMLQLRKIFTFYRKEPFLRLDYQICITSDWSCARATLNLSTGPALMAAVYFSDAQIHYRLNKGAAWFNLPRHDQQRWLGYTNQNNTYGLAVIGADPWNWQQLPGKLLSSSKQAGGFTLELIKWPRQELRIGDTTTIQLFLAPFHGKAAEEIPALQQKIAPGM